MCRQAYLPSAYRHFVFGFERSLLIPMPSNDAIFLLLKGIFDNFPEKQACNFGGITRTRILVLVCVFAHANTFLIIIKKCQYLAPCSQAMISGCDLVLKSRDFDN